LQGFDEYMNLVLDDAEEISMKKKTVKPLGVQHGFAASASQRLYEPLCRENSAKGR
jgi:small nuclear ribonucleoprotein (snRNP)-like protein